MFDLNGQRPRLTKLVPINFIIIIFYSNIRRKPAIIHDLSVCWEPVLIQRILLGFESIVEDELTW